MSNHTVKVNFLQGGQGGGKTKIYKAINIFSMAVLILNMSAIGVFFTAKNVSADEPGTNLCPADLDVVLIIDRSGSMGYDDPTRLSFAKTDANLFLDKLGTNDQSALVSYSTLATLDKGLSNDHASTKSAVSALAATGATNIGDAIKLANDELGSGRARPQAVKVVILLTDGRANKPNGPGFGEDPTDVAYAEAQAAIAATAGYKIFTIGLGTDVNTTMLQNIASVTGGTYYLAPSADDLQSVYDQISQRMCEYGSISGCKYIDDNNDGDIAGESKDAGWPIILGGDASMTQNTSENGCYSFTGLLPGNYTVNEGAKSDVTYTQTYPVGNSYSISLTEGQNSADKDFGNYIPSCGNQIVDTGIGEICEIGNTQPCEAGGYNGVKTCLQDCSGWGECIPTESCGDGIINDSEQCDGTNMGAYNDDHHVCQNCVAVYVPYCGDNEVNTPSETCDTAMPETCTTGNGYSGTRACTGCQWGDCTTEQSCGDGTINGTELCDDGANNGTYGFCNTNCTGPTPPICGNSVKEGNEECDAGPQGSDTCTTECTLRHTEPGKSAISGCKYNDGNNNGQIDEGEVKLSGWEILLIGCPYPPSTENPLTFLPKSNINTNPAEGETGYCSVIIATTTNSDGCYEFNNLAPGSYGVSETTKEHWLQTYPAGNSFYYFNLVADQATTSIHFANHLTPYCGDGACGGDETCSTCSTDCGGCGGGGGGGGGIETFNIYDTAATQENCDTIITWRTNYEATSRVYYDTEPHSTSTMPSADYVYATIEDISKVTGHNIKITGLEPNTTYYFRAYSESSSVKYGQEIAYKTGGQCAPTVIVKGEEGAPSLKITKQVSSAITFANQGDKDIEYLITVTNEGNLTAFGVNLKDVLPAGFKYADGTENNRSWDLGDIEPGKSKAVNYKVNVEKNAKPMLYKNIATATAVNFTTPVQSFADLNVRAISVLAETGFSITEFTIIISVLFLLISLSILTRRKYLLNK